MFEFVHASWPSPYGPLHSCNLNIIIYCCCCCCFPFEHFAHLISQLPRLGERTVCILILNHVAIINIIMLYSGKLLNGSKYASGNEKQEKLVLTHVYITIIISWMCLCMYVNCHASVDDVALCPCIPYYILHMLCI